MRNLVREYLKNDFKVVIYDRLRNKSKNITLDNKKGIKSNDYNI